MPYFLVVDQGTTGTRASVYDSVGRVVGRSYRRHAQVTPRPGWVEHDPVEIWVNTVAVMREALRLAGIEAGELAGVGVTNQRETTVVWERGSGRPVYNAIVWQDTRTATECSRLRDEGLEESLIRPRTGLFAHTYFSATKLAWILRNVPGAADRARAGELLFGTIDTWLVWNMTKGSESVTPEKGGAHVTDATNASRTMLMRLDRLEWDPELLEVFGVPEEVLPEIYPSTYPCGYGVMRKDILGAEVPVLAMVGDQQAALIGQAGVGRGDIKVTYGTGAFLLMNTGEDLKLSEHGLLTTVAYSTKKGHAAYALEGSIAYAGALIDWLRDGLGIIERPGDVARACRVGDSGGVYFVPALSGLFAPYWDPRARGLIIGLTKYTRAEHIIRAAAEGIGFRVRDVVEAMGKDTGIWPEEVRVDGGVSRNDCLMQIQANILGSRVVRPVDKETTSLGAFILAARAAGVLRSLEDSRRVWAPEKVFSPSHEKSADATYARWKKAVEKALQWLD